MKESVLSPLPTPLFHERTGQFGTQFTPWMALPLATPTLVTWRGGSCGYTPLLQRKGRSFGHTPSCSNRVALLSPCDHSCGPLVTLSLYIERVNNLATISRAHKWSVIWPHSRVERLGHFFVHTSSPYGEGVDPLITLPRAMLESYGEGVDPLITLPRAMLESLSLVPVKPSVLWPHPSRSVKVLVFR